ncbi:alpha/beta-Hydrolases superfamily protein [Rhynchospora pubera]|uniref:Alpha/beta-Hydrolases superfamily protein n=1 Tax=Rhynchospora pubera TaxID=906938 RepID=A0AAV8F3P7_9POAL|nr:alpha/beta-Hydrolases superfamily protein [Rhynchospora pubera]
MVNFIKVQEKLLHVLARQAGLRLQPVEVEPGTVMSFWVPKGKATAEENLSVIDAENLTKTSNKSREMMKKKDDQRPAVVLVHGFAFDGLYTWQFQIGALAKSYDLYVPDLLFFGLSQTSSTDRSVRFQADCMIAALMWLGVEKCTVVGFSYGGFVAFKMAEIKPDMVHSLVISGSLVARTESKSKPMLESLGRKSFAELLLPETVEGLKALLSSGSYRKFWLPNFIYKDFLEVMFSHRKERAELLEAMIVNNNDVSLPNFSQKILLLWGDNDSFFRVQLAKDMKECVNNFHLYRISLCIVSLKDAALTTEKLLFLKFMFLIQQTM